MGYLTSGRAIEGNRSVISLRSASVFPINLFTFIGFPSLFWISVNLHAKESLGSAAFGAKICMDKAEKRHSARRSPGFRSGRIHRVLKLKKECTLAWRPKERCHLKYQKSFLRNAGSTVSPKGTSVGFSYFYRTFFILLFLFNRYPPSRYEVSISLRRGLYPA